MACMIWQEMFGSGPQMCMMIPIYDTCGEEVKLIMSTICGRGQGIVLDLITIVPVLDSDVLNPLQNKTKLINGGIHRAR